MSTPQGWRKRQIANKQEINMSKDELLAILRLCNADSSAIDAVELAYELGFKANQLTDEPVAWMNKHGACKTTVFREIEAGAKEEYNIPLYARTQSIDSGS